MRYVAIGLVCILGLILAVPLVMMFSGSLIPIEENIGAPNRVFPRNPTLENFGKLRGWPIGLWFFNSSFTALMKVGGAMVVTTMAAFGISKFQFRGRSVVMATIVVSFVFSGFGTTMPKYLVCRSLGLFDSYAALIVPSLGSAMWVWFLVKFMRSIPNDLIAMGRLDGLGPFGLLRHVILPMSAPPLAGLAGLAIVGSWQGYLWPLIITRSKYLTVLPVGIREVVWLDQLVRLDKGNPGITLAGAVIVTIPGIILFLVSQRYLVNGLFAKSTGGE